MPTSRKFVYIWFNQPNKLRLVMRSLLKIENKPAMLEQILAKHPKERVALQTLKYQIKAVQQRLEGKEQGEAIAARNLREHIRNPIPGYPVSIEKPKIQVENINLLFKLVPLRDCLAEIDTLCLPFTKDVQAKLWKGEMPVTKSLLNSEFTEDEVYRYKYPLTQELTQIQTDKQKVAAELQALQQHYNNWARDIVETYDQEVAEVKTSPWETSRAPSDYKSPWYSARTPAERPTSEPLYLPPLETPSLSIAPPQVLTLPLPSAALARIPQPGLITPVESLTPAVVGAALLSAALLSRKSKTPTRSILKPMDTSAKDLEDMYRQQNPSLFDAVEWLSRTKAATFDIPAMYLVMSQHKHLFTIPTSYKKPYIAFQPETEENLAILFPSESVEQRRQWYRVWQDLEDQQILRLLRPHIVSIMKQYQPNQFERLDAERKLLGLTWKDVQDFYVDVLQQAHFLTDTSSESLLTPTLHALLNLPPTFDIPRYLRTSRYSAPLFPLKEQENQDKKRRRYDILKQSTLTPDAAWQSILQLVFITFGEALPWNWSQILTTAVQKGSSLFNPSDCHGVDVDLEDWVKLHSKVLTQVFARVFANKGITATAQLRFITCWLHDILTATCKQILHLLLTQNSLQITENILRQQHPLLPPIEYKVTKPIFSSDDLTLREYLHYDVYRWLAARLCNKDIHLNKEPPEPPVLILKPGIPVHVESMRHRVNPTQRKKRKAKKAKALKKTSLLETPRILGTTQFALTPTPLAPTPAPKHSIALPTSTSTSAPPVPSTPMMPQTLRVSPSLPPLLTPSIQRLERIGTPETQAASCCWILRSF